MVALTESCDYFSVVVVESGGEPVVVVKGEIDLRVAEAFWDAIATVLADEPPRLVIDMVDTTFIDSSGLNVLLHAYAAMGRLPEALVLRAPSPGVRRVIALAGIEDFFSYDSYDGEGDGS
jgi:anti-anti-sigma factor